MNFEEDFEEVTVPNVVPLQDNNPQGDVIELDRLFDEDEEVIDVYEENLQKEEIRQKKITKIQIGLIIFLVISASLIYLFGYNLFEPFIKID